MKSRKNAGLKVIYIVIAVIFIAGSLGIMLYPFANRSLKIEFITKENSYMEKVGSEAIARGNCRELEITGQEEVEIKKVRFYGRFHSMILKELSFGEFASYIDSIENGEINWGQEQLRITGERNIRIRMNDSFVRLLQDTSSTFLQERLLLWCLWSALIAALTIGCNAVKEWKTENNRNNHGPLYEIKKFTGDVRKYKQYMIYAAKTDLKAEVADSYLNRLWWLLEPFFNMIVYVIVFGNVMGNSVENYATFIFSALLMWNFFSKTINYSVKLVRNNKDIITKVYIPKFVILLSNMILNFFKLIFSMTVLVVMMLIFRVEVGINIVWVIPAYLVLALLSFGLGMIFMHFGVYVDDLSYAVGILINMLMFLSGIFYEVMTTLPEPLNGVMICLNPIALTVDTMRNALLYNTAANLPLIGAWLLISFILCFIGIHIVYKNENGYVKIV